MMHLLNTYPNSPSPLRGEVAAQRSEGVTPRAAANSSLSLALSHPLRPEPLSQLCPAPPSRGSLYKPLPLPCGRGRPNALGIGIAG